jgi:hypothetical protein
VHRLALVAQPRAGGRHRLVALCLVAGETVTRLLIVGFTLAWTHSVERVRWEEDWQVAAGQLVPIAARIKGSGAGMEAPDDAVLADGYWTYRPRLGPLDRLELARSDTVADWQLCLDGNCRSLGAYLPAGTVGMLVTLRPCPD